MSDLFSIFNISKRGMFTQQKSIGVTSHNIANANTKGYSRQRALIETTKPFGMPSMNSSIGPGQLGTGSKIEIIERVRDEFLDFQIRKETSVFGRYESREKYLKQVESIFNEPTEYGLSVMTGKFFEGWYGVGLHAESSNARTMLAQQSDALAKELNHTYDQLKNLQENVRNEVQQKIFDVNGTLNQLDDLNQQIMSVKISGMEPNDLMDKRDLLIDELSKALNIQIDKKEFNAQDIRPVDIEGLPNKGEKLLVRKEPNYRVSRFSYINSIEDKKQADGSFNLDVSYYKLGNSNDLGKKITITGIKTKEQAEQVKKHIEQCGVLWADESGKAYSEDVSIDLNSIIPSNTTEITDDKLEQVTKKLGLFIPGEGELKGFMSIEKDVDGYIDNLNKMAKSLALAVNTLHNGAETENQTNVPKLKDTDGKPFFVNKNKATYTEDNKLEASYDFSTAENEINAGNISMNRELLKDVMKINTKIDDTKGEGDGSRALAIAGLQYTLLDIQNVNNKKTRSDFVGNLVWSDDLKLYTIKSNPSGKKIDAHFKDTVDELGVHGVEAQRIVKNQKELLNNFTENKDSVSGVSMDEEMANLIQFQHAYQANAKMISIIDQLLDVVVNGLVR